MGKQTTKAKSLGYWFHVIVTVGLMISGFFMSGNEMITPYGMQCIMIFAGMMWGWIFWNLSCPSFLAMGFMCLTQYGGIVEVMQTGVGSEIVLMVIVLTTLGTWAQECGLCSKIADWLLSVKMVQNRPWLLIIFIFAMAYIVAFFVGIYVTIFTFWPIVYTLAKECGYQKQDRVIAYLLIGIAYIVAWGGLLVKPYGAWSLVAIKSMNSVVEDAVVDYGTFMAIMIPISLVGFFTYILLGKLLRLDVAKLGSFEAKTEKIVFTKEQKICVGVMVGFVLCVFAPSFLPKEWLPIMLLNKLGTLGIGVMTVVIMCTIRLNYEPMLSMSKLFTKGTPWDMVWLLSANTVVAAALLSAEGGVRVFLAKTMAAHLSGLTPLMFIVAILIVNVVATQFMHNTVLLMVLTPIYVQVGLLVGVSPVLIALLNSVSLSAAMATPGASSRSGLFFGNTEWIAKKDAYLLGSLSVVSVVVALIVMVPLSMFLLA